MQIFIKTLTGKTIVVDVEAEESVLSVKKKIAHQTGIAVSAQRLIIAGRQIYDYKNIGSYNPQQINCIHLVPRLNNEFNFEIDFESDDVELLWTVNYLDENEGAFPQETYELIGVRPGHIGNKSDRTHR
jgi:ubiquitin-large subunit ribosomal protein L40e